MRKEKKRNGRRLFLPIFIISILVLSVFGVMIGGIAQNEDSVKYNGVYFRSQNGAVFYKVNGIDFRLFSQPQEVEGFYEDLPEEYIGKYKIFDKIYLDVSKDSSLQSMNNFYENMGRIIPINFACSPGNEDMEGCADLPIKTCDGSNLIINFEVADEKETDYSNGCLTLKGSNGFLNGISDVLILTYTGVLNG